MSHGNSQHITDLRQSRGPSEPRSVQELWSFMQHLQTELSINRSEHAKLLDDFVELRHVNSNLMKVVDRQAEAICKLEVELDNLDQYSRNIQGKGLFYQFTS